MSKGYSWKPASLSINAIHKDDRFQVRAAGTNKANVRKLRRVLDAGNVFEPIKVAKVGQAHYLVDGWHRLEALELEGADSTEALVATMTLAEAQRYSLTANAAHGQSMSRADKQVAFERFVQLGDHLDTHGLPKPSREIRDALGGIYSHEHIRQKLKALGLEIPEEIEYPHGYKPHPYGIDEGDDGEDLDDDLDGGADTLDPLAGERGLEAHSHIAALATLLPTLSDTDQDQALRALKALVGCLESGIWQPAAEGDGGLDI